MKKMVSENINDFIDPEEKVSPEELEGMPDEEFSEDENGEEYIEIENSIDQMKKIFRAEIAAPEFSRLSYLLKLKDGGEIESTPMAELSSGDFLFKIEGQLKKIRLSDIQKFQLVEEELQESLLEDYGEYSFSDYLWDISNFIEANIPDWKNILDGEDEQNLVDWLEENQDLWDLRGLFATGISSDDIAIKILGEFQKKEEE
jgi:hypothetical protein